MMNLAELRDRLSCEERNPADFRIQEPPGESTWCIKKQGKVWLVFYSERGTRWELQRFKEENAACEYFYHRLTHG